MKKSISHNLFVICCILCLLPILFLLIAAELNFFWIYLLLLEFPFVALTTYTVIYLRKRIIKPLNYLIAETTFITSGDLSRQINYQFRDEIGVFISIFNQMRESLYQQQQQQQQFEVSRKNFVDSISHDLKTPLASISAYVEALQDRIVTTPTEQQQYLAVIENKITILTNLSNQLSMSYESPDSLPLSKQGVSCYHWLIDFFYDIELECQTQGITPKFTNKIALTDSSTMQIDIFQLDRAIQNIISNALRFCKQEFSVLAEIKDKQFILSIKNDGVTDDQPNLAMIFERFYTEETIHDKGHLGLGLYISQTIIHAMNGDIQATLMNNTITFTITLPL